MIIKHNTEYDTILSRALAIVGLNHRYRIEQFGSDSGNSAAGMLHHEIIRPDESPWRFLPYLRSDVVVARIDSEASAWKQYNGHHGKKNMFSRVISNGLIIKLLDHDQETLQALEQAVKIIEKELNDKMPPLILPPEDPYLF